MYGGRAIDSFDRRILTVYMDEYLGDFIFDTFQTFHFYKNDTVDYKIPEGVEKDHFVGKKCFSWYLSQHYKKKKKASYSIYYLHMTIAGIE